MNADSVRASGASRPHAHDQTALTLVMLLRDGLYFNSSLTTVEEHGSFSDSVPSGPALAQLVELVQTSVISI